jgi:hypothetical protein
VFQAVELPASTADLYARLTDVKAQNFPLKQFCFIILLLFVSPF